uniref:Calmodulin n=2 Tax=Hemiselmis andersenii TaxID=464988 RepID=A0A6U4S2Q5_HEMAN|mmetsp:Transcript_3889/g.8823  ORF Transcript_3889/g.8823 Transcript_3889/m.8823 type:complete len:652 (+) Transcript_3889:212-2167(+)
MVSRDKAVFHLALLLCLAFLPCIASWSFVPPALHTSHSAKVLGALKKAQPSSMVAGLSMSGAEGESTNTGEVDAYGAKKQAGNAKKKLGPGLFDPEIQLGSEVAQKAKEEKKSFALPSRERFMALFHEVDEDKNGMVNREELIELCDALGQQWSVARATRVLWSIDTDKNGFVSADDLWQWCEEGGLDAEMSSPDGNPPLMPTVSKDEARSLFQIVDVDADGKMDSTELASVVVSAGITMNSEQVAAIHERLDMDKDGKISFEEFFAWYSSGIDFVNVARNETAVLFAPTRSDERSVFVRGFPWKARERVAERFFSRCGEVEHVKMVNWTRDDQPSGRCVVTFKETGSVDRALTMHRNRMGRRWLEVYRVNRGDREEVKHVGKHHHGALIGIEGKTVQHIQAESGARLFFGDDGEMVIKGLAFERAKAWAMAQEVMKMNTMDRHPVEAGYIGRLIGARGAVKKAMERESGAHIVYEEGPEPSCKIYGTEGARTRAWQMVQDKLWDLEHACEERFNLDRKYHGTLIGRGSATVQELQRETGARVRFESSSGENLRGSMVIRGTPQQCKRAWDIAQILLQELPPLLSELREEDIALGALRSLPLSPGQVWGEAVRIAMERAVARVPPPARSVSPEEPPQMAVLDAATPDYLML